MSGAPYPPKCTGTKTCTRCKEEKHALAFNVNPQCRDGLSSWCRVCAAESVAESPSQKERKRKAARKATRKANLGRWKP